MALGGGIYMHTLLRAKNDYLLKAPSKILPSFL